MHISCEIFRIRHYPKFLRIDLWGKQPVKNNSKVDEEIEKGVSESKEISELSYET